MQISGFFITVLIIATSSYLINITQAEKQVRNERDRAIELIQYMNFDLSNKLEPIGRLDIMKGVQKRINQFFDSMGKEMGTKALRQKAIALTQYATTLKAQGKLKLAEAHYQQALAITKKLAEDDPSNANWQSDLSVSYIKLFEVYQQKKEISKAIKSGEQGLKILNQLQQAGKLQGQHKAWPEIVKGMLNKIKQITPSN